MTIITHSRNSAGVHLKRDGFTLLEIMVAVAIMSISFIALFSISGNTLVKSGRAEHITIATMLARNKIVEIEMDLKKKMRLGEFPDEKSEDGKFDEPYDDYSWSMEIRKVELPAPVVGDKGSMQSMIARQLTKEIARTIRELKLTVKWNELSKEQSLDVITHIAKM